MIKVQWVTMVNISDLSKHYQNYRIYATAASRKRQIAPEHLLWTRSVFSKSVMVSVGVSKSGRMDPIFVDGEVRINGAYYVICF